MTRNQIRMEKLLRWRARIDGIRRDPDWQKSFNMAVWSSGSTADRCGTVACAGGYATAIFPELKLVDDLSDCWCPLYVSEGQELRGEDALSKYFDVSSKEIAWVCYPGQYRDLISSWSSIPPSEVLERIDRLIDDYRSGRGVMQE